jgi:RNA polymerase sigma-70 factor (ECF subfamily)
MGVVQGLQRFEARSSLKTWIFRILTNCAKTRGQRESRCMAFSTVWGDEAGPLEPAVDPERFRASDPWQGHWISAPRSWDDLPEDRFLSVETQARLHAAIATLPASQQEVIRLRDVEGWGSDEVCRVLEISEANQRVLLHRARSKVRRALEQYFEQEVSVPV